MQTIVHIFSFCRFLIKDNHLEYNIIAEVVLLPGILFNKVMNQLFIYLYELFEYRAFIIFLKAHILVQCASIDYQNI